MFGRMLNGYVMCMYDFIPLSLISCSSSDTYQDGLVSSNGSLGDCSCNNGRLKDGYDHAKCINAEKQNNAEAGASDHARPSRPQAEQG